MSNNFGGFQLEAYADAVKGINSRYSSTFNRSPPETAGCPCRLAALLLSPWADLILTGTSMDTKQEIDPLLSRDLLLPSAAHYVGGRCTPARL